jgi:hypothetical protein
MFSGEDEAVNNREFRQRLADLVASQRRAAYEGPSEDPAAPTKKPPAKETAKVKTRRKKA